MSEPKWTKGEWKARIYLGGAYAIDAVKPNGDRISHVATTHSYGEAGTADARVLAAAKDLYVELRHLVMVLEPVEQASGLGIPGIATLNGARAALAKAMGEASSRNPDAASRSLADLDMTPEERKQIEDDMVGVVSRAMVRWLVRKAKEAALALAKSRGEAE